MKNKKLIFIGILLLLLAQSSFTQGDILVIGDRFKSLLSGVEAKFYCEEPVTELIYEEAKMYLGDTLKIKGDICSFFDETQKVSSVEIEKHALRDYFYLYSMNQIECIDTLSVDSIYMLTLHSNLDDPTPPMEILLINDQFITNYKGYFYFFD
jgi:hypothetical protein